MHSKFLMVRARYLKVGDRVFDMEEGDTFPVIKIASSGYEAKLLVWVWYGDYCRVFHKREWVLLAPHEGESDGDMSRRGVLLEVKR